MRLTCTGLKGSVCLASGTGLTVGDGIHTACRITWQVVNFSDPFGRPNNKRGTIRESIGIKLNAHYDYVTNDTIMAIAKLLFYYRLFFNRYRTDRDRRNNLEPQTRLRQHNVRRSSPNWVLLVQ